MADSTARVQTDLKPEALGLVGVTIASTSASAAVGPRT